MDLDYSIHACLIIHNFTMQQINFITCTNNGSTGWVAHGLHMYVYMHGGLATDEFL